MHSADYAVARCLSVTRPYFVETFQHIIKLFHHWVAGMKNSDLRPISRYMSEMIQDTAKVTI